MPVKRVPLLYWKEDQRKLMPLSNQFAAWRALADARDLLADIATTMRLLSHCAFAGQTAARDMSLALQMGLLELDIALGEGNVVKFETPQPTDAGAPGRCALP